MLINVACYDNVNESPTGGLSTAILLRPSYGQLVIDGLYYDGGGSSTLPFYASVIAMDSVYLNNIHVMNCLASRFIIPEVSLHPMDMYSQISDRQMPEVPIHAHSA
jgi:hypothetical protein